MRSMPMLAVVAAVSGGYPPSDFGLLTGPPSPPRLCDALTRPPLAPSEPLRRLRDALWSRATQIDVAQIAQAMQEALIEQCSDLLSEQAPRIGVEFDGSVSYSFNLKIRNMEALEERARASLELAVGVIETRLGRAISARIASGYDLASQTERLTLVLVVDPLNTERNTHSAHSSDSSPVVGDLSLSELESLTRVMRFVDEYEEIEFLRARDLLVSNARSASEPTERALLLALAMAPRSAAGSIVPAPEPGWIDEFEHLGGSSLASLAFADMMLSRELTGALRDAAGLSRRGYSRAELQESQCSQIPLLLEKLLKIEESLGVSISMTERARFAYRALFREIGQSLESVNREDLPRSMLDGVHQVLSRRFELGLYSQGSFVEAGVTAIGDCDIAAVIALLALPADIRERHSMKLVLRLLEREGTEFTHVMIRWVDEGGNFQYWDPVTGASTLDPAARMTSPRSVEWFVEKYRTLFQPHGTKIIPPGR